MSNVNDKPIDLRTDAAKSMDSKTLEALAEIVDSLPVSLMTNVSKKLGKTDGVTDTHQGIKADILGQIALHQHNANDAEPDGYYASSRTEILVDALKQEGWAKSQKVVDQLAIVTGQSKETVSQWLQSPGKHNVDLEEALRKGIDVAVDKMVAPLPTPPLQGAPKGHTR